MDFSSGWFIASLLVGAVGTAMFIYGKKQQRIPQLAAGITLLVISYAVTSPAWMVGCGVVVIGALWAGTRAGL